MLHLNPETGETGKCKAEKGGCPFQDASDPNNGHYETQEEIDAYRERVSEARATEQGLSEGLETKMTHEEEVKRAEDTSKDLKEALDVYNGDYADIHKVLTPVIDKHFGQGATDRFYKELDVDGAIKEQLNSEAADNAVGYFADTYYTDNESISPRPDFSKPDGSILTEDFKNYVDENTDEGIYSEVSSDLFKRALEADELKSTSNLGSGEYVALEVSTALVSKSGHGNEGKLFEAYYKNYAEKHNLVGRKPNMNSYPESNGYQIPAEEMTEGIKGAVQAIANNQRYSKLTPLGSAVYFGKAGGRDERLEINYGSHIGGTFPTYDLKWEETGNKDKLRVVYGKEYNKEIVLEYSIKEGKGVLRERANVPEGPGSKVTLRPAEIFEPTDTLKDGYSSEDVKRLLFSEYIKNKISSES